MENFPYSELPKGEHYLAQTQSSFNKESSFHNSNQPSCGFVASNEIVENIAYTSGSKKHSQTEKRRRDRISAHLNTLRKLISKSEKMDKAALLGSVVEHIKDLKRKALETSHFVTIPSDFDEVTIECYIDKELSSINLSEKKEKSYIKASFCCEDRPELLEELNQGLKGLQLTIVRGEMACLGKRIKSILILCFNESGNGGCITSAIQSLMGVFRRIMSFPNESNCNIRSKRQRLLMSSCN